MALSFPNRSRSFNEARKAVRFLAHDGMFEIPFFVGSDALLKSASPQSTEAECLVAFDAARRLIEDVAQSVYASGHRSVYILTRNDFQ
ncbi:MULTISPECIES: DUF1488 domain-containing protein [unclassified Ensifer]|uniref:DUF1488 domain-containing protein n=1 Tax=unclassified Ensifer TaxID=2633371 RepID=UPI000812E1A8|nr:MULTISPECIES: DUF1488 domain-containing protein [unclassified Ensifer]OCP05763.1 hypothetical protein BBX50_04565 [Ensifer sp. LC11]OCP06507.1 hypothetical protein BC374_04625 [Ensifer sp. LC13]OCP06767.1 hypothetical protein BC362_11540 [Ensifer sp. LC14]OCP31254.1 hypothetical protein BC364_05470 [Ensifer sp. LC499]